MSGDVHKILRGKLRAPRSLQGCAGNFALRARCKVARGTSRSALVAIRGRDAVSYLYEMIAYFAQQKYGSERAVSKVGYFFDSLSSLKLSLYIAMT